MGSPEIVMEGTGGRASKRKLAVLGSPQLPCLGLALQRSTHWRSGSKTTCSRLEKELPGEWEAGCEEGTEVKLPVCRPAAGLSPFV